MSIVDGIWLEGEMADAELWRKVRDLPAGVTLYCNCEGTWRYSIYDFPTLLGQQSMGWMESVNDYPSAAKALEGLLEAVRRRDV